jgi:hypothetical protein
VRNNGCKGGIGSRAKDECSDRKTVCTAKRSRRKIHRAEYKNGEEERMKGGRIQAAQWAEYRLHSGKNTGCTVGRIQAAEWAEDRMHQF